MAFFDEIFNGLELKDELNTDYKVLLYKGAGYFGNILSIKSFKPEEIVLSVKGGKLIVVGENLFIKKYCFGDVLLCGKIVSVSKE